MFFVNWWSDNYSRPFKDPLLMEYSLEELMYEYYYKYEKKQFNIDRQEEDDKIIEDRKWQEAEDWASKMEAQEEEALKTQQAKAPVKDVNPLMDPKNIEWMEKHLQQEKERLGDETFGEDLSMSFEEEG